ncbi:phosphodiesterase [Mycolicibacterium sp.]|uniref:phosphodiesterase n=1 Tax=Mycolicibacterium sp. TaxID=2320850 RepID=UPI003D0A2E01
MNVVSDIAGLPIQVGAALRQRRLFHPIGVLAHGSIERVAAAGDGLPMPSGPIVGRVSKALGTPGALPDAAGLAWRMHVGDRDWDVLLATAGVGAAATIPNRLLLHPVTSWPQTQYSSLMPLRHAGRLWWIRARLSTDLDSPGLALDTVVDHIGRGGLSFDVEQACGSGPFQPLARLTLTQVISTAERPDHDVAFDPVRNSAPGVQLWPDWLRRFRRLAYRRSRTGRHAAAPTR